MKTRSAQPEPPNIAAIVKARHHARTPQIGLSFNNTSNYFATNVFESGDSNCDHLSPTVAHLSGQNIYDDGRINTDEKASKPLSQATPKLLRGIWTPDDRRLFFQAVQIVGCIIFC